MSKIALTPNASGTGTFTLAAPNSNTSRTITLPDEAGEVLVNTATGINVTGNATFADNGKAIFGAGSDLQIYHNSANNKSYIEESGTGNLVIRGSDIDILAGNGEAAITVAQDGAITLYNDNNAKLATTSTGVDITGTATADKVSVVHAGGGDFVGVFQNTTSATPYGVHIKDAASGANGYPLLQVTNSAGSSPYLLVHSGTGNVGIGTSSPTALMHINGSSMSSDGIHYIANNTSSGPAGIVMKSGHGNWKIMNSQTVGNALEFIDGGSPDVTRMMIDSSGSLLVGKTALNNAVGGSISAAGQAYFVASSSTPLLVNRLGSDGVVVQIYNDSNGVGSISVSGSSTAYNTSSDYRLKTDAQPMTGASARVQALNPVNFEWIADGTRVDGFLAHEAQEVVPEAVIGTKDAMRDEEYEVTPAVLDDDGNVVTEAVMGTRSVPDYQGIDQSKLVPLLTAALQEALTKIDDMEARLAALEA